MAVERIARLSVEVGANIKAFNTKMASVGKRTEKVRAGFARLGAAAKRIGSTIKGVASRFRKSVFSMKGAILGLVTGLVIKKIKDFINTVVDLGDQFAKTSKKIGIGVEVLSGLKFAADLAGTSFQAVTGGFRRLASAAFDANEGLAESQRAFDALGIQVTDSDGKLRSLEDLFFDSADALQALTGDTERAALAQDLFGRAGLDLIPLLKQGSVEIRKQIKLAKELGITFSKEDAKGAEDFKDQITILRAVIFGFASRIVKDVIPAFVEFFKVLTEQFKGTAGEGKTFAESVGGFIKGLLFVTIGAVELMKSVWNGLKIIWLGLKAAFLGLQVLIGVGLILLLSKFRSFAVSIQDVFNKVFKFLIDNFDTFTTGLITSLKNVIVKILNIASDALGKLSRLADKIPGDKAAKLASVLGLAALKATQASDSVAGLNITVEQASAFFDKLRDSGEKALEGIDKAMLRAGDINEELRVKLQGLKDELDKIAESEAIPFWERARQTILALVEAEAKRKAALIETGEEQDRQADKTLTFAEQLGKRLKQMSEVGRTAFEILGKGLDKLISGFSDALAKAILFGQNFKEAMINVFRDLAVGIIRELIRILVTAIAVAAVLSVLGLGGGISFGKILGDIAKGQQTFSSFIFGGGEAATPLQAGGIVTRPTFAMIGERGPEAVIPLGRNGAGLGTLNLTIELDGEVIARSVIENTPDTLRLMTGFES